MDTPQTTASGPISAPSEPGLLNLMGTTSVNGIGAGSRLVVPAGLGAVVVFQGQPLDLLGAGNYVIDDATCPILASRAGSLVTARPELTVYSMPIEMAVVTWTARASVGVTSSGAGHVLFQGRCGIKIVDPRQFLGASLAGVTGFIGSLQGAQKQSIAGCTIDVQVGSWLRTCLSQAVLTAVSSTGMDLDQIATSREPLRALSGQSVANWLASIGLQCAAFDFDGDPRLERNACAGCGSRTAPTAFGTYRRTMSFLVIRYSAKREGNFCTPCAAKVSAQYNLVMLACGWWGYVGLFLTPFYLIMNCFNFMRTAFGKKLPSESAQRA